MQCAEYPMQCAEYPMQCAEYPTTFIALSTQQLGIGNS